MNGPYQLLNALFAHDGPIRCACNGPTENEIITGCQGDAPNLRRWKLTNDFTDAVEINSPIFHDHWVTAVTTLSPDSSRSVLPGGCIVSGCMDSKIRIFDLENVLLLTLEGHKKGVISFSWTSDFQLLSGSWDGTAILWDIIDGVPVQVFGPHENGVHVLSLPNGLVATTSTGESVEGQPANFKLRFWDVTTGDLVGKPIQDHQGSIRSITYLPGVNGMITSSNDGTIMLRSLDGAPLDTFAHPFHDDGTPTFILDTSALYTVPMGMDFVSGAEDGTVMVWCNSNLLQSIQHANTIWTVLGIPSTNQPGLFATGGQDGILRIFTSHSPTIEQYAATIQSLNTTFLQDVKDKVIQQSRGPSAEDLAKAPKWELRGQYPGKSEHQVMVFNQNDQLIAGQWTSGAWVIIGEVTGSTQSGGYIDNVYYDHVLPVEIETSTGLKALKLGYQNAENPFVAAQRFLNANALEQHYLAQIADWITKQTSTQSQQQQTPTLGVVGSPNASHRTIGSGANATGSIAVAAMGKKLDHVITGYVVFDEVPAQKGKIISKVKEFNTLYKPPQCNSSSSSLLSDQEIEMLEQMLETLLQTSHYHVSTVSIQAIGLIAKIVSSSTWPIQETHFLAYDLLRLVVLHPQGSELLAVQSPQPVILTTILTAMTSAVQQTSGSHATMLMLTRCVVNMLRNDTLRPVILLNHSVFSMEKIISLARHAASFGHKLVRFAGISVIYNLIAALVTFQHLHPVTATATTTGSTSSSSAAATATTSSSSVTTLLSPQTIGQVLQVVLEVFQTEKESIQTVYRGVAICGTIGNVLGQGAFQQVVRQYDGKHKVEQAITIWKAQSSQPVDTVLLGYLQELVTYLS